MPSSCHGMTRPLDPVSTSSVDGSPVPIAAWIVGSVTMFMVTGRVQEPSHVGGFSTGDGGGRGRIRRRQQEIERRVQAGEQAVGPAGEIQRSCRVEDRDRIRQRCQKRLDDRVEEVLEIGLRGCCRAGGDGRCGDERASAESDTRQQPAPGPTCVLLAVTTCHSSYPRKVGGTAQPQANDPEFLSGFAKLTATFLPDNPDAYQTQNLRPRVGRAGSSCRRTSIVVVSPA